MEAVFGFVEDNALWTIEDVLADFFARVGGEAVHEVGAGLGKCEEFGVHLIRRHFLETLRGFGFVAHRDPYVGVDHIGIFDRFLGISGIGKVDR